MKCLNVVNLEYRIDTLSHNKTSKIHIHSMSGLANFLLQRSRAVTFTGPRPRVSFGPEVTHVGPLKTKSPSRRRSFGEGRRTWSCPSVVYHLLPVDPLPFRDDRMLFIYSFTCLFLYYFYILFYITYYL